MSESWDKSWCPKCKEPNWICDGDMTDCTRPDIEAIKCWSCKHAWLRDEEFLSDFIIIHSPFKTDKEELEFYDNHKIPETMKTPERISEMIEEYAFLEDGVKTPR